MENWLYNSNVVITGASSGIGKEISKILISKYKCNVLGIGRKEEKLKLFKDELGENSSRFDYLAKDVSSLASWPDIFEKAKQLNCNILINNAGTMHPFMRADKLEMDKIESIFKTNFYSCVYGYKTFCDYFISKRNCGIINISSASAVACIPGVSFYSASKSALTSFSKIVSSEERKNFFVGTYMPGFTKTNLYNSSDNEKAIFDDKALKIINKISMGVEKLAKKIVKCIAKKKRVKVFGVDSWLIKKLSFFAPVKSTDLVLKIFKKTGFECFEEI